MTYALAALAVWLLWFPAALFVFHAWASFMEWLADKP